MRVSKWTKHVAQIAIACVCSVLIVSCGSLNTTPIAGFEFELDQDYAPAEATFDASNSADLDGQIVSYAWEYGDGETGLGENTTHTYTTQGTYVVTLEVLDDQGASDEAQANVEILAPPAPNTTPPEASFTFTPSHPTTDELIHFDASSSNDPASLRPKAIVSYAWSFGDGESSSGEQTQHAYQQAASYVVTLKLTDNDGAQALERQTVLVTSPDPSAPVASFSFSPEDPIIGEEVTFDAEDSYDPAGLTAKSIASYTWDFGDEETTSGKTATHIYMMPGEYEVTLTVTDNEGAVGTAQNTVEVGVPAPPPPPG